MTRRTTAVASIAILATAVFVAAALGSKHDRYGPWDNAAPLAGPLNTGAVEGCPMVSPNGKQLYIASNRSGGLGMNDIWISERGPAR